MMQLQEEMFNEQKRQPQIFEEQAAGVESFMLSRVPEIGWCGSIKLRKLSTMYFFFLFFFENERGPGMEEAKGDVFSQFTTLAYPQHPQY